MRLRDALDDHKRHRDHPTRFPGERRTTAGAFSGAAGRLVHVAPDGGLRDFGYPLSGRSGVSDSRFGLLLSDPPDDLDWGAHDVRETEDGVVVPFGDGDQSYRGDAALVETRFDTPVGGVVRLDLTVATDAGLAHATRVEPDDPDRAAAAGASLLGGYTFVPDGREGRVGQLRHDDAVELFHDRERDFLAGAPALDVRGGGLPRPPEAVLSGGPADRGGAPLDDRREGDRLGGRVVAAAPLDGGGATLATLLSDREEASREESLSTLSALLAAFDSTDAFVAAAESREPGDAEAGSAVAEAGSVVRSVPVGVPDVPEGTPRRAAAVDDLRALALLSAPTGLRIAGPDFDPHYVNSGGYGYTWFRDDAEISGFLRTADAELDLGLGEWHRRSARAYLDAQLPDGTWPHRVWPRDGALAPGWANARLEAGADLEYQADQTASVVAFLARFRAGLDDGEDLAPSVDEALSAGLDGMCESLAGDGRPVACQNAWEDADGRFAHTAARFLDAFAAVAALDGAGGVGFERAAEARALADDLYDALDDLWVDDRGVFAVREHRGGGLDARLDSATFALADAHRAYAAAAGTDAVDARRLDRLASHVGATLDGLYRDPPGSDVAGLVRYEGDGWRRRSQPDEKIWTVSTAWGANAAAELSALLADSVDADDAGDPDGGSADGAEAADGVAADGEAADGEAADGERGPDRADEFAARARDLLRLVGPEGPLTVAGGYLPEQFFDDGTPDSATPLGWPHAIRLATTALLAERDELGDLGSSERSVDAASEPVATDD